MPGKYRVTGQKVEPVAILPATAKLAEVFASRTPRNPCTRATGTK